ncbi:Flp/Fap pilin component [compost metagenome]
MRRLFRRLVLNESGQDLIEYALLAALIAVTSITALQTLSPLIPKIFADIVAALA